MYKKIGKSRSSVSHLILILLALVINSCAHTPDGQQATVSGDIKNSVSVTDKKVASDMETIKRQPEIARQDPAKIPQILVLMRNTINASEYPAYFNHLAIEVSDALLTTALAEKNPQWQVEIINNYILNLFPKTGVDTNLVAFIGRAMSVAELNRDEALKRHINSAFLSAKTPIHYQKSQWLLERGMLDYSYRLARANPVYIDDYLWLSTQVTRNNEASPTLPEMMATQYTRLLIATLVAKNYPASKKLGRTYMDKIYPVTGYSEKSTDVISHILVAGLTGDDDAIADQAATQFVENPDYNLAANPILHFNMACYYARRGNKVKMLDTIQLAISYGHDSESFYFDQDFKAFRDDPDFIALLEAHEELE